MRNKVLRWLNLSIFALLIAALIGAGIFYFSPSQLTEQPPIVKKQKTVPSSGFTLKHEDYQNLTFPPLQIPYSLPSLRIPDLRNTLKFHGKNNRPDAKDGSLFFSLGDSKLSVPIRPKIPHFLKQEEGVYIFSPRNHPTDLWLVTSLQGPNALVNVYVQDENGKSISEPKEYSSFTLPEKPIGSIQNWQIDTYRVDGTLLARQKAKWSGRDLFLEQHGGDEFSAIQGKQRITFGEGENLYTVYVDKGEVLAWKNGKWHADLANTDNLPLLKIDKIDERLMGMTLFSPKGDHKLLLNLLKTPDPLVAMPKDFQFQGARTRLHSMFHINKKREMVGPDDWFLKTTEGWKKIRTGKEVDEFIRGESKGLLFVLERVENEGARRFLVGTLYNASRSDSLDIRLPLFVEDISPQNLPMIKPPRQEEEGDGVRSLPPREVPAALQPRS